MVDFKLTSPSSPMLFAVNGYQLVVMPMMIQEAIEAEKLARAEQKAEAEAKAKPTEQAEQGETEPETTEPVAEHKPKRSRKKQAVTA